MIVFGARRKLILAIVFLFLLVIGVVNKLRQLPNSIVNQLEIEHRSHQPKRSYFLPETGSQTNPHQNPSTLFQNEYWLLGEEAILEKMQRPSRKLSDFESAGNNIMIAIRTTKKFHQKRLPYLYDTWLNKVNGSNVFLVTDAEDEEYQERSKQLGIHYVVSSLCGESLLWPIPSRWYLCCRTGEALTLMYKPQNIQYDWFCYLDDDIYLIMENLIKLIAKFPKDELSYIGRPGTPWEKPHKVSEKQTLINNSTRKHYHFASGGFYCLSRTILDKIKPWIVGGHNLGDTCRQLLEPDDLTIGCAVELLGGGKLSRTLLFHHHGMNLAKAVNANTLKDQIAIPYGCGQMCKYGGIVDNAIEVPNAAFSFDEDPSRFRSLHCHLYPQATICK
ncbi:PREDICTED: beta-1,3-N-acetylglucosaminyltransferase lunatic fringe-like [Amphimedon queenslandica]|uniref:Fringe-like glycosyltransferase domain-containing protein n=1 Tax=Amphimedon queenslandica TaxID=400682 RepID=A0AAN0J3F7_AMPQE|nr:PREDICTED: beta-1,3-N-acetylglucosaminyltransferase lunatic fringe-like [Amphimedon queenslandica]|eukprot:XP_019851579.1 PREDICTED: beta-1,3-N-acetylglucosaminyltransferase lunatic fringe-like [Amphimedon queenslandica]